MSTTDAGHSTDAHNADHGSHGHGHDSHDHDHPSYLAHHFDTPEQQFDSGKLGMWLFLVTEVLFFSGMFCAYAIFRAWRPEVFEGCSQFLNTKLGAINTGVLLFSSLTMAWAVRCAQLEENKKCAALIATTLSCAMMFLGVKAIEYSHKWAMGLLPAGLYSYDPANPHPEGTPNYLLYICLPFILGTIGIVVWGIVALARGNKFQFEVAKPLLVVFLSFFVGVKLGQILEPSETHDESHVASVEGHEGEHGHEHDGDDHDAHEHAAESHDEDHVAADHATTDPASERSDKDLAVLKMLATDSTNTGLQGELSARQAQSDLASGAITYDVSDDAAATVADVPDMVDRPSRAGVFFSIYYCMTGVHAIHILAGIGVLIWLLVRCLREDFNRNYFGPVDYVGLYWHLVDLIWIYLFPLMYLIR